MPTGVELKPKVHMHVDRVFTEGVQTATFLSCTHRSLYSLPAWPDTKAQCQGPASV